MSFLISKLLKSKGDSASAKPKVKFDPVEITPDRLINLAIAETAQSDLAKKSKIGVALDAIFTGQIAQIAQDEVDTVRAFRNKKLFDGKQPDASSMAREDMNIIVCDDINRPQEAPQQAQPQAKQPILPWVLSAAMGAAGLTAGAAYLLNKPSDDKPVTTVTQPVGDALSGVGSTTQLIQGK